MTGVRREVGKIFRGSATGPIHAAGAVDPNQVRLGVDVFTLKGTSKNVAIQPDSGRIADMGAMTGRL
jgi:hypothetical protein